MVAVKLLALLFVLLLVDINEATSASRRVFSGFPAPAYQFPYFVKLIVVYQGGSNHLCGGGIISDRFVLTAAHCVSKAKVQSVQCVFQISNEYDPYRSMTVERSGIIVHSQFNPKTLAHDIALLHLPRAVKNTEEIQKLEMPDPNKSYEGYSAKFAGFGSYDYKVEASNTLLYFEPKVVNLEACQQLWNPMTAIKVTEHRICVQDQAQPRGQSICFGDSGGPLVVVDGDTYIVIGLSSSSHRKCDPKFPQVLTRVSSYLDWIYKIIN